jgi:hypothetical protein
MADEPADEAPAPTDEGGGGPRVVWLDWAGGAAAVILAVILVDIWTDGRFISRALLRWRDKGEGGGPDVPAGQP